MPVALTCPQCGRVFLKPPSAVKFDTVTHCSMDCRRASGKYKRDYLPRVTLSCRACGQPFTVRETEAEGGRKKFCSKRCINLGRTKPNPLPKRTLTCPGCGKTFQIWPSWSKVGRSKYCSRSCSGRASSSLQGRRKKSGLELLVLAEMGRRGVAAVRQHRVWRWTVDIALPELHIAIEADGNYWHTRPGAAERDTRKDADLTARGWTVLRFWERDIRESPSACVDRVLECIARRRQSA